MDQTRLSFGEAAKVAEFMFLPNIGSSKFQERAEKYLTDKFDSEAVGEI